MKKPTKADLEAELRERRNIGDRMANVCFNASQSDAFAIETRVRMKSLQLAWDGIARITLTEVK